MDVEKLRAYARLIARMGVNVQPGQEVVIRSEPEQTDFLEILIDECYRAGAARSAWNGASFPRCGWI